MTDRLTTAVDALEQAPSPVRWEDVLRRVEEDAGVTLAPTDAGRAAASVGRTARLRRRAAVAAAVLVLVGVGVAWPRRDTHTSVTTRSGSTVPASTPTSAH
ncbi:MAG: hypothetical protein JWM05_1779, partial [Acidimicrobiales bacterium]|nr:hypothetical protein [Acidimicrobiales bacterium]